jgi:hypothetical protein
MIKPTKLINNFLITTWHTRPRHWNQQGCRRRSDLVGYMSDRNQFLLDPSKPSALFFVYHLLIPKKFQAVEFANFALETSKRHKDNLYLL